MTIVPVVFGAGYGIALWGLGERAAVGRGIALGRIPPLLCAFCGLTAAAFARIGDGRLATLLCATVIGAVVCGAVDARTGYIFDALTLSLGPVLSGLALLAGAFANNLLASIAAGGMLFALYLLTKRRGIGLGDVKLAALLGLGYGLAGSVIAIGSAFIFGAAYGVVLLSRGHAKPRDRVRFGPFLAGGAIVAAAYLGTMST